MSKWEKVRLGEIFKISSGGTPSKNKTEYYNNGNIPWVRTGDLKQKYINSVDGYITEEGLKNSSAKIFPRNTVLIAMYGATIGACSILNIEASTNQACAAFLPSNNIDSSYLYYFLTSKKKDFINMGIGGAQPNISATILKRIEIPLPPLEVQKQIAATLDAASELLTMRKQQLAELDVLVKSVFYEMFGDPVANKKGWENVNLGNLCTIIRGGSPRPIDKYLGGSIPWIKISDADKSDNIYLTNTKEYIYEEGIKKSRLIPAGSMIFANCGVSLGFARIITFSGCIHDGWLAFNNISERLNKIFLLKQLNEKTEYFRKIAPSGTQPNLNTNIMKNTVIICPPLDIQNQFADIVTKIEEQKALVKQAIDETQQLFDSLMSQYFDD